MNAIDQDMNGIKGAITEKGAINILRKISSKADIDIRIKNVIQ